MSISVFDLFKIGIGPSSSHTVGPMIAAKRFIDELIKKEHLYQTDTICIELFGSLGSTGKGHGTAKAIILGLEGDTPSDVDVTHIDERIELITHNKKLRLANTTEINFNEKEDLIFYRNKNLPYHSNGMRFRSFNKSKECVLEKFYYSVGGGFIVNEDQAKNDTPLIQDKKTLPYPFNSGKKLLELCQENQLSIADIMLENEQAWHNKKDIRSQLDALWSVMQACVDRGCRQQGLLPGGLKVERRAIKLHERLLKNDIKKSDDSLVKDPLQILDWVTLYALAVNEENASGGRIVTAPTNGAAGIIPAVLHYYSNFIDGANQKGIYNFLLTAAAIGILFKENASISGAEVGCQGEVGSACSMAAAGLTAVLGGTPAQIENAAEIAMEHHLGLTCDPIGGLVQIPCIERNAVASVKAIHASRIALSSDGSHFVSLDKVIKTMRETGKDMLSKYKETSRGGLATNVIDVPVNIIEC